MKSIRLGKIVIILRGKYAGKKGIVVDIQDKPSKARPYPCVSVAGIKKGPQKVTRSMSAKKIGKRLRIKPFVKTYNIVHIIPTRYSADSGLKKVLSPALKPEDPKACKDYAKKVKKTFSERYMEGKSSWLFRPLRF